MAAELRYAALYGGKGLYCEFEPLWGKLGSTLQRKTGHLSAASVRGKFVLWEVSLLGRFKSESPEKDNSFF